jgi:ATP adenylyltransferase
MQKPLWAPWRIEYILGEKSGECFLCRAFKEDQDRENLVLKRAKTCVVVMNRFPYNNGHLMIVPLRHIDAIERLTPEEQRELMDLTARSVEILKQVMNPQGFNIGLNLGEAAGAGLKDHLHQHIVPRWAGDTNFMPVLGDVRVIPQALLELYDRLAPAFA